MAGFHEFLLTRLDSGGFSTEDALASFLPLARQVAQTHSHGQVAPLDGVASLQVEGVQIWFPEASARSPVHNHSQIRLLDKPPAAVEVLSAHKRSVDVDQGPESIHNLLIGSREQPITLPVYLPGYICWEHQVGHHDPLSDVFCLGMILASFTCGLDLNQPEDLQRFVESRRNLFRLTSDLHPVLAKAIVRMTELSRHRRPQDIPTLIDNLEHYRDQTIDFDFDIASKDSASSAGERKQVLLTKLQERLFELSRRNRLLHFRSTLNAVNLTHASVPLAFDVQSIKPDQILTWHGPFAKAVSAAEPVSLNRYLNFAEQLYLPSVLDRIRADAVRDAAEFGFEQLRLAICFLRWANVKVSPPELYDSPLVLLPVRLIRKKGVRDSYWLEPLTTEAELNPVVRHLFKQLYDLSLPASIDLSEMTLGELHRSLAAQITASEPGVTLSLVDRPRIDLIHDQAKRRLDRYRRSARLSGRGIRSFLELDYSYNASNFQPLGLALFRSRILPTPTHLREIVQENPSPRNYAVAPDETGIPHSEKQKQFYALRENADDNPYNWDFDLCRLTLGNFKYRKMTLVRDYAELAADGIENPAFDAIFSLVPRPLDREAPQALPLEDRFHIVSCDPTQTSAIALARAGASYIIQGPPGTGKSQTITNLIADYVVQGKRVLFVCEKRAAIDVVYARLKQQGLHPLCCLIHDSQTDKKEFILDLKATYESLLAEQQLRPETWQRRRASLLKALREELAPLEQYNQVIQSVPQQAGRSIREVLARAVELSDAMPQLSAEQNQLLPDYALWLEHAEAIEHLVAAVGDADCGNVLAQHPLRVLSSRLTAQERPTQLVTSAVARAQELLQALLKLMADSSVAAAHWSTLQQVLNLCEYASNLQYLAERDLLDLLDAQSARGRSFAKVAHQYASTQLAFAKACEANKHWIGKLPVEDVAAALELAKALEGTSLSILKPAWWRLRKAMNARYRFAAHAIRPRWSQVLEALSKEYQLAAALAECEQAAREQLHVSETLDVIAQSIRRANENTAAMPADLLSLHQTLIKADGSARTIIALLAAASVARDLHSCCASFLEEFAEKPLETLQQELEQVEESSDLLASFVLCLEQLAQMPQPVATAFRHLPFDARALEAAVVGRCVDELFRSNSVLNRFDGTARDGHVQRLAKLSRQWLQLNAAAVVEKARHGFLEHIRVSSLLAAQLTSEQKDFKAIYNRGRRALEHEFGKVMRHKSIRDLVAGDSGLVIGDLKPVWLMSPLSVSDTLPLRTDQFDVVIFDEASQITLEEAVPPLFRSRQVIVVGDEMQLPPTDFFSAKTDSVDEDGVMVREDGQVYEYDLSSNSFLNHAAKNLSARMLGWHYRSRSESLISFSNWAFYQGKLLTVPELSAACAARPEILATSSQQGDSNVAALVDRPLSFHYMVHAVYDNRRNRAEAEYIAHLVRGLLMGGHRHSIGIVAFSEAQQTEIESALSGLAEEDKAFGDRLDEEYERQIDGQYAGLLIKNLENIQGDERDVVILSVCYGRDADGRIRMNFGPINQSGGEKRLNVAFSRAKHHMAIISSIRHSDITNDYNDGANCLKSYLQYAAVSSIGDAAGSHRLLRELAVWRDLELQAQASDAAVIRQLAAALKERGYAVELGVGMSHFRCDVAVRRHAELQYRLGILVDTEAHYQQADLLEREMLRPQLLQSFGWSIAHVLTSDWYRDRRAVVDRLVRQAEQDNAQPMVTDEDEGAEEAWEEFDEPSEPQSAPLAAPPGAAVPNTSPRNAADAGTQSPIGSFNRHFEFVGGGSSKFWEVGLAGNTITVRFGRIGSSGQTQTRVLVDEATAARTARRLIDEKLAKGYVEKAPPAAIAAPKP